MVTDKLIDHISTLIDESHIISINPCQWIYFVDADCQLLFHDTLP